MEIILTDTRTMIPSMLIDFTWQ